MHVHAIVICKNEDDSIQNERAIAVTTYLALYVFWDFPDAQGQITLESMVGFVIIIFSILQVKSMQRPGIEAIRTQLQPSKPKREITNITNS